MKETFAIAKVLIVIGQNGKIYFLAVPCDIRAPLSPNQCQAIVSLLLLKSGRHGIGVVSDIIGSALKVPSVMETYTSRKQCPSKLEATIGLGLNIRNNRLMKLAEHKLGTTVGYL